MFLQNTHARVLFDMPCTRPRPCVFDTSPRDGRVFSLFSRETPSPHRRHPLFNLTRTGTVIYGNQMRARPGPVRTGGHGRRLLCVSTLKVNVCILFFTTVQVQGRPACKSFTTVSVNRIERNNCYTEGSQRTVSCLSLEPRLFYVTFLGRKYLWVPDRSSHYIRFHRVATESVVVGHICISIIADGQRFSPLFFLVYGSTESSDVQ